MKTVFTKDIGADKALEIAEAVLKAVAGYITGDFGQCYCPEYQVCSCTARFETVQVEEDRVEINLDHYGAKIGVFFKGRDVLEVWGSTCGGNIQSLMLDLATGNAKVIHEGRRQSALGSVADLLPKAWWDLRLDCQDWRLAKYETTRKSWAAISCWLKGQHGTGPRNLHEEEQMAEDWRVKGIEQKCRAVGYYLPENWQDSPDFRPDFAGVHYRRAAAVGIQL